MMNRILSVLPQKELRLIAPQLKPVELAQGAFLYTAGESIQDIYFPETATISFFSETAEGATIEVCVIGKEGVAGIAAILDETSAFRAVVQLPGKVHAIRCDALRREFKRCENFRRALLNYTNALLVQIAQTAVCNKFHSVEARFCRSLLMAHDRSANEELPLTQEALARVLGARRASVSVTASSFQQLGAIRYSRGVIRILDRRYLEAASCECYETISAAHSRIRG
jgi:CRP-like cAMP-binding protein